MMFHRGQKVVCVDDKPRLNGPTCINKGSIYTIADIVESWDGTGVLLEEVKVPPPHTGWHADRFRPIAERKTDITVFQQMLVPNDREMAE